MAPEARRNASGSAYFVALPPEDVRELAHILWALEIGAKQEWKAGLIALGENPNHVRHRELGEKVATGQQKGGRERSRSKTQEHDNIIEAFTSSVEKDQNQARSFKSICGEIADHYRCTPDWIQRLLRKREGITRKNFRSLVS